MTENMMCSEKHVRALFLMFNSCFNESVLSLLSVGTGHFLPKQKSRLQGIVVTLMTYEVVCYSFFSPTVDIEPNYPSGIIKLPPKYI